MAGQGRHRGPVTTRVEALVRALPAAVSVPLDSWPPLLCAAHVGGRAGYQLATGGNATADVLPVDGGSGLFGVVEEGEREFGELDKGVSGL